MTDQVHADRRRPVSTPSIVVAVAALVAFLLLNGHGNHLLSLAPLLILFACPLMHLFMHHGHGGHGGHDGQARNSASGSFRHGGE